ncbi:hypothetical protein EST38_g4404 [Candolleomyces aberdarensis]|uniref:Peptidase A1 domain-containing protein n=1 Tax=Candolleomyces aberdarensis TaxID=2316362 RepID=A0A4Q2DPX6_9AGAR|nr:hypothetical protein EST38_g4404 [Candolleomyces aberdarensis]
MKYASLSLSLLIVVGVSTSWVAATLLEFRRVPQSSTRGSLLHSTSPGVHPRGTSGGGPGDNRITNHLDLIYSTNITLGGKDFVVLLDTGSTDLWVLPDDRAEGLYNITDIPVRMEYGGGSSWVEGTIAVASLQMGTFSVSQQAFLRVESFLDGGLKELGIDGLLGLSFDFVTASPINEAVTAQRGLNTTWGSSVLKNIFSQDGRNGSNFIAFDLSRTDDLEDIDGGSFSIGEYADQWKAVAQAPKLYQHPPGSDRWTTLLEGITVGGTPLNLSSVFRGVPDGRLVALLDTGTPTALIPRSVQNDLYSRIPGAVTFTVEGQVQLWLMPCNTTTIVEFNFGGQRIPIHPLDLSFSPEIVTAGGQQYTACFGAMDGNDALASHGFEMSLGDTFLRNVYSVYDFGDPNGTAAGQPYMQLLAQTEAADAMAQVASIRSRTMADLPPEIEPTRLLELLRAEGPTMSTAAPPSAPPPAAAL